MAIYLDILKITLDFEDSNVTAVNANYAPFTFLSLFHLPGRGSWKKISKVLLLQEKEGSTSHISTAQERKTL